MKCGTWVEGACTHLFLGQLVVSPLPTKEVVSLSAVQVCVYSSNTATRSDTASNLFKGGYCTVSVTSSSRLLRLLQQPSFWITTPEARNTAYSSIADDQQHRWNVVTMSHTQWWGWNCLGVDPHLDLIRVSHFFLNVAFSAFLLAKILERSWPILWNISSRTYCSQLTTLEVVWCWLIGVLCGSPGSEWRWRWSFGES